MSRQERRRAELLARRGQTRAADAAAGRPPDCVFESEPDADHPGWTWLNIRLPAPGMPAARYAGDAAADRIRRFVDTFAGGRAEALVSGRPFASREMEALDVLIAEATTAPGVAVAGQSRAWILTLTRSPDGWRLVAQLWPRGRGSVESTWKDLAQLVAHVATRTGHREYVAPPESVTRDPGDPGAPHVFAWPARGAQSS